MVFRHLYYGKFRVPGGIGDRAVNKLKFKVDYRA